MSKFKTYKLDEILTFKYGKDQKKVVDEKGEYPILGTGGQMGWTNSFLYNKPSVLIGRKGTINNPFYMDTPFWTIDTLFYTEIDEEKVFPKYLFYKFRLINFLRYNEATGVPSLKTDTLNRIPVTIHEDLPTQQKIANVLSALDTKISLNNRINAELEAMAKTLYDYWFVQFDFPNEENKPYKTSGGTMVWNDELKREIPEGWEVGTLLDIADYTNGLACQKFRPIGNEDVLKVIKIREMHEGFSSEPELVRADIPEKVKIANGDVLFSWSASLELQIWAKGKGALNQHIFKVTSNKYPKSFYFYQLVNYLQHFKMMAENRKTTMGHITQEHLLQSRIVLPPKTLTIELEEIIAPLFEKKLNNELENQQLATLRDWLLPMLMNGQVVVE